MIVSRARGAGWRTVVVAALLAPSLLLAAPTQADTPLGHLRILVLDEWGFPLDRAKVTLHGAPAGEVFAFSDEDGIVEFRDLEGSDGYLVEVTRRGIEALAGQRVIVAGSRTTTAVVHVTAAAGMATVVVRDAAGDALAGAKIDVSPRGVEWWNDDGVTDARGVVRFHGPAGGEREVTIRAEGYATRVLTVPLASEGGTRLDVVLTPTPVTVAMRTAPYGLVVAGTLAILYLIVRRWRRLRREAGEPTTEA